MVYGNNEKFIKVVYMIQCVVSYSVNNFCMEFSVSVYIVNATTMAFFNNSWSDVAPFLLDYNYTVKPELKVNVSQRIRNFYFPSNGTAGSGDISIPNWLKLVLVSVL